MDEPAQLYDVDVEAADFTIIRVDVFAAVELSFVPPPYP